MRKTTRLIVLEITEDGFPTHYDPRPEGCVIDTTADELPESSSRIRSALTFEVAMDRLARWGAR